MARRLPALVRALLDPAVYPHPVDRVELIETHISWVLLAGERVYKIKKPVDLGFLDFTTLARRHVLHPWRPFTTAHDVPPAT